jgi:hypothetical protein
MQRHYNSACTMQNNSIETVDRRWFCRSLAGLAAGAALIESPAALALAAEPEFVIVNGWVLTRQDLAFAGTLPDVA